MTDFTGMNLVPFLITVHYIPEDEELLRKKIPQANYPVRILTDQQAILVKDEKYILVGDSKEIIFK